MSSWAIGFNSALSNGLDTWNKLSAARQAASESRMDDEVSAANKEFNTQKQALQLDAKNAQTDAAINTAVDSGLIDLNDTSGKSWDTYMKMKDKNGNFSVGNLRDYAEKAGGVGGDTYDGNTSAIPAGDGGYGETGSYVPNRDWDKLSSDEAASASSYRDTANKALWDASVKHAEDVRHAKNRHYQLYDRSKYVDDDAGASMDKFKALMDSANAGNPYALNDLVNVYNATNGGNGSISLNKDGTINFMDANGTVTRQNVRPTPAMVAGVVMPMMAYERAMKDLDYDRYSAVRSNELVAENAGYDNTIKRASAGVADESAKQTIEKGRLDIEGKKTANRVAEGTADAQISKANSDAKISESNASIIDKANQLTLEEKRMSIAEKQARVRALNKKVSAGGGADGAGGIGYTIDKSSGLVTGFDPATGKSVRVMTIDGATVGVDTQDPEAGLAREMNFRKELERRVPGAIRTFDARTGANRTIIPYKDKDGKVKGRDVTGMSLDDIERVLKTVNTESGEKSAIPAGKDTPKGNTKGKTAASGGKTTAIPPEIEESVGY